MASNGPASLVVSNGLRSNADPIKGQPPTSPPTKTARLVLPVDTQKEYIAAGITGNAVIAAEGGKNVIKPICALFPEWLQEVTHENRKGFSP